MMMLNCSKCYRTFLELIVVILSKDVNGFFGADVIALKQILGCKDVSCKPCSSDVIEHKVRHRCNHAYCQCTGVVCNAYCSVVIEHYVRH